MLENILMFSGRNRILCLLIVIAISVACYFGLGKLRLDTSLKTLIINGTSEQRINDEVSKEFGSDNTAVVVVEHNNLFSTKALRDLKQVANNLKKLPYVTRVDSLFSVKIPSPGPTGITTKSLIDKIPTSQTQLKKLRKNVLKDKLLKGSLISANGKVSVLSIVIAENTKDDPDFDAKTYTDIQNIIKPLQQDFKQVFLLGKPRTQHDLTSFILKDLGKLSLYSVLVLMFVVWLFMRRPVAVITPIITATISLLWAFGIMGYLNIPVNLLSAMLPSLVIVMGSTEDVHMLSAYLLGIEEHPGDRMLATRYAVHHVGIPVLLTTFTALLGFMSNITSNIQLIIDFAYASSLAILMNGIVTVLFMPILLVTVGPLKVKHKDNEGKSSHWLVDLVTKMIQTLVTRFGGVTLLVMGVITLVFLAFIPTMPINNNPMSYFKSDNPLLSQSKLFGDQLSGTQMFYLRIKSKQANTFKTTSALRDLDTIIDHIKHDTPLGYATGLSEQVKYINQKLHGDKASYFKLPEDNATVKRILNAFKRSDIKRYVNKNFQTANIVVQHDINNSTEFNSVRADLEKYLHRNFGDKYQLDITSLALLIDNAATNLLNNEISSLLQILVVIFIIMSLMFTTIRAGLLSLLPIFIPIILMFGLMGMLQISLSPASAVLAVIIIGIAIDDTMRLFTKYNSNCRLENSSAKAIEITLKNEAFPVITSSIALAGGFLMFLLSNFQIITDFGVLAAFTIIMGMIANLLMTPILLQKVRIISLLDIVSLKVRKDVIETSPLFKDMKRMEVRKAILLCESNHHKAGDLIIEQGSVGRKMYLILSGEVEISSTSDSKSKILSILKPGDTFGEIAYVSAVKRIANAKALTDVEVMVFNQDSIKRNTKRHPRIFLKMTTNISAILGERLKHANELVMG